jgi:hypothetical protein
MTVLTDPRSIRPGESTLGDGLTSRPAVRAEEGWVARRAAARETIDTKVGRRAVGATSVVVLTIVFVVIAVALLYAAMAFWPPIPASGTPPTSVTPRFLGTEIAMTLEQNLLLLAAVLGGLGAMGHVLRSYMRYVGERRLLWSWVPSYFMTPFIGAVLATVTYILLRAGLISGAGVEVGNVWGFAAVATLVGLFSAQAASKLKDVFETVFAPAPTGSEPIEPDGEPPAPLDFAPQEGQVGTPVVLRGEGLETVTEVAFGGDVVAPAVWVDADGGLTTTVPAGATTGPLTVRVGPDVRTTSQPFTVT